MIKPKYIIFHTIWAIKIEDNFTWSTPWGLNHLLNKSREIMKSIDIRHWRVVNKKEGILVRLMSEEAMSDRQWTVNRIDKGGNCRKGQILWEFGYRSTNRKLLDYLILWSDQNQITTFNITYCNDYISLAQSDICDFINLSVLIGSDIITVISHYKSPTRSAKTEN